jgi:hypothetical protein
MKVDKMSVSLAPHLGEAVRAAARRSGRGLSWWVSEAVAQRLRDEAFDEFLSEWEQEFGPLTPDELAEAAVELGLRHPGSAE